MKHLVLFLTLISLSACMEARIEKIEGPMGPAGRDGKDGEPGKSCSVAQASNGAVISCEDGTSVLVLNGENGQQTPYTIIEVIDLCNNHKEVLLRFGTNQIIGHYAGGGNNQHLRMISPGNWVSTDGANCYFRVNNDMSVSY